MTAAAGLYRTAIGKKLVMAVSGVVWLGYVIGHLLGNLQVYAGPERINGYSEFLHHSPVILWGTRALLAVALVAHVVASLQLTQQNLAARPVAYAVKRDIATSYAALTMVYSGPILLLFLLYHLAHLTFGATPHYVFDEHNVYNNVVYGFRIPWLSAIYVAAMAVLGAHLYHGVWSAFQTVGIDHPSVGAWRRAFAAIVAVSIIAGYASIPLCVMTGILRPAERTARAAPPRP